MILKRCYLTQNECYKYGRTITPKGVMVHSTGANNPNLRRYVAPNDGLLGENTGGNHWNQYRPDGQQKCVHAFIGKLADGTVATYQTLPWNMRGWHGGGSSNNCYIGFEICEDGLHDPVYFNAVYKEAVELTAYLCKEYNLDPYKDGTIICHCEGYKRGIASNHADVMHWFPIHGKSMDTFREDVIKEIKGEDELTQDQFNAMFKIAMEAYANELNAKAVSDYAKDSWNKAKESGILDGTFPQAAMTREQAACVMDRLKLL